MSFRVTEAVIDAAVVSFLIVGTAIVKFVLKPVQLGYYCSDTSIQLPFYPSTVPAYVAYVVATALLLIIMLLTEFHNTTLLGCKGKAAAKYVTDHLYRYIGYYAFGVCCTMFVTHLTKVLVGRLRPNFMHICHPSQKQSDLCANDPSAYVSVIECDEMDESILDEGRQSFPSGHSSFVFFAALYAVLYIQSRAQWRPMGATLLGPVVQLLCLVLALSVALSRVSDHKHHWSDVLAGSLLGAFIAYAICVHCARFFTARWRVTPYNRAKTQSMQLTSQLKLDTAAL